MMTVRDYFAAKAVQGNLAKLGQLDDANQACYQVVSSDAYRAPQINLSTKVSGSSVVNSANIRLTYRPTVMFYS